MKSKRLIPFWMLPASWGLKGQTREIAQAEYNLEGEELERELARIKHSNIKDYNLEILKIEKKYNKLTEYEYLVRELDLKYEDGPEKQLALLDMNLKHKVIDQLTYEKECATIRNEPWVHVKRIDTDRKNPAQGAMELDWNKAFIKHLEENGYGPAPTEEEIVDLWLNELCRNIAFEAFDGVGDFNEKMEGKGQPKTKHEDVLYRKDLEDN